MIKLGDTYYMVASYKHFILGIIILKSKDLVNDEFTNHMMPAPIKLDKNFEIGQKPTMDNLLILPIDFSYNGEKYFAYWGHNCKFLPAPDNIYRMQNVSTKSMEGSCSESQELK